jgi:hypothetical protein
MVVMTMRWHEAENVDGKCASLSSIIVSEAIPIFHRYDVPDKKIWIRCQFMKNDFERKNNIFHCGAKLLVLIM